MKTDESKQILIAITELQTNMKTVIKGIESVNQISHLVMQIEQSSKSSHNRIDDLKKDTADKLAEQKKELEEKIQAECKAREKIEGNITWLWRTFGAGLIAFVFWLLQQNWGG